MPDDTDPPETLDDMLRRVPADDPVAALEAIADWLDDHADYWAVMEYVWRYLDAMDKEAASRA